jgi:hypothetical protein
MNNFGPAYSPRPRSVSPTAHRRSAHSAHAAQRGARAPAVVTTRGAREAARRPVAARAARCPNSGGLRTSSERATHLA